MENGYILIEVPKSCQACGLGNLNLLDMSKNELVCPLNKKNPIPWEIGRKSKPDWCPIKELPDKRELEKFGGHCMNFSCDERNRGWNDCLDKLLGNDNE